MIFILQPDRMVDYVGEWQSHPKGFGYQTGCLDVQLLASLIDRLAAAIASLP